MSRYFMFKVEDYELCSKLLHYLKFAIPSLF